MVPGQQLRPSRPAAAHHAQPARGQAFPKGCGTPSPQSCPPYLPAAPVAPVTASGFRQRQLCLCQGCGGARRCCGLRAADACIPAACRALVDELEWEIGQVDPRKTIQMGSFRINPDGSQSVVEVSRVHRDRLRHREVGDGLWQGTGRARAHARCSAWAG